MNSNKTIIEGKPPPMASFMSLKHFSKDTQKLIVKRNITTETPWIQVVIRDIIKCSLIIRAYPEILSKSVATILK